MTNTIKIKGDSLVMKYTLRMYFVYESFANQAFAFGKLINEYLLFYSCLAANNDNFSMRFDDFIDLCDADPVLFSRFKEFLLKEIELRALQVAGNEPEQVKKKTKRTKA